MSKPKLKFESLEARSLLTCVGIEPCHQTISETALVQEVAETAHVHHDLVGNPGIFATGLKELAGESPDSFEASLNAEQEIELWQNEQQNDADSDPGGKPNVQRPQDGKAPAVNQGSADSADDKARAEIYRANHKKWGNYQGICGTALMEMARLYPELYEDFLKTEQEIEKWLNEQQNDAGNDSSGKPDDQQPQDSESPSDNQGSADSPDDKLPEAPDTTPRQQQVGDIDEDGEVGFSDFLILSQNFGRRP